RAVDRRVPRRQFRPATQTGTKPCLLRQRRALIKSATPPARRLRRAHRPAIDPGGLHAHKKRAVEPRVPCAQSAITNLIIHRHGHILPPPGNSSGRFRTSKPGGQTRRLKQLPPNCPISTTHVDNRSRSTPRELSPHSSDRWLPAKTPRTFTILGGQAK